MILTVLLELGLGLLAWFVGLVASLIGVGSMGGGEYTMIVIIVVLPLGLLSLALALLYALWRPRFAQPLRWSLLVAFLGALLVLGWFALTGMIGDAEAWAGLIAFVLPAPLLQGLLSGLLARRRQRSA